jgi:hypothetical protein
MKLGYYPEPIPPDNGLPIVPDYFFNPPAGSDWSYVLAAWDGVPDSIFQEGIFTTMPQAGIDITGCTASCFASQSTSGSRDMMVNAGEWIEPGYSRGPFIVGAVYDPQSTASFQPDGDGSGRLVLDQRSPPDGMYEFCSALIMVVGGVLAGSALLSNSAVAATDAAAQAASDAAAQAASDAAAQAASDAAAQAASDAAAQAASDAAAQAASDAAAQQAASDAAAQAASDAAAQAASDAAAQQAASDAAAQAASDAAAPAASDAAAQTSSLITPETPGYADLTGNASALNPATGVAPDINPASGLNPSTAVTDNFMNNLTQQGVDTPASLENATTSQIITSATSGVPVSDLTSPTASGLMASPSGEATQLANAAANGTVIDPATGLPITDASTGLPSLSPSQIASAASTAAKLVGSAVAGGAAAAGSAGLNSGSLTIGNTGITAPGTIGAIVLAGLAVILLTGKKRT